MDKAKGHDWQDILSRYENSGLTQKAFCEANELKYSQFKNYLHRLKVQAQTIKSINANQSKTRFSKRK